MKTRTEIIKETVEYYSEDTSRRAYDSGACSYLTEDGRMCAVGRLLTDCGLKEFGESGQPYNTDLLPYIKDEYQIDDFRFWRDLQKLHDEYDYWDENGLTIHGKDAVEFLLNKYRDELY